MEEREKRNAKQSENIFKERSIRLHGLLYQGVCKGGCLRRPKMGPWEHLQSKGEAGVQEMIRDGVQEITPSSLGECDSQPSPQGWLPAHPFQSLQEPEAAMGQGLSTTSGTTKKAPCVW